MRARAAGLAAVTVAALLCASCADEAPEETVAVHSPLPDTGGVGPIDALSRRFGRVRSRMVERGYAEELGVARLFVLEGEGLAFPSDLDSDRCTTLVALAGGSVRDLRMTVYGGEGEEVADDPVDGEGALVHVCPQTEEPVPTLPHHVVLWAPEGSGSIVVGAFGSASGEGTGFDALFDGILPPRVPFRAVEEQLARSRSLLRARGMLQVGEPAMERVAEGESVRTSVQMEPDRCYVVVGRGGEGLRDVDLLLYDEAGAEVARDLESDPEPSIEHCPAEGGRYTVEVSAYEGAGALGAMVLAGPVPQRGEETAAPVEEATQAPPETPPSAAVDDPAAALMGLAGALAQRGYADPVVVVRDGYLSPGEVRTREMRLAPGCSILVGAAGRPDMDLDLYLADEAGQPLDRDTGIQPMARVRACPETPAVVRLSVKAYGRRGPYALAVLRAPESIRDVQGLRLEEAAAGLRERGYRALETLESTFDTGERFERNLVVRPGTCLAVVAAGDVGVEDLDVFLRDAGGDLVASASDPEPYAAVSRCAGDAPEALRVEVLMYRGAGAVQMTRMEGAP